MRLHRREWNCHFVESGHEALEVLNSIEVDVVVSDMRMPGMDGAQLLREVQLRWPKTARLILSGQADQESLSRALPVTHQFLAKPCESTKLAQILTSVLDLQARTHNRAVLEIVGNSGELPTLEPHLFKISGLLAEGASSSTIANAAAFDPLFASRILQIANSPYFGASRMIVSLADAVTFLGHNMLKSVLIACQASRLVPELSTQQVSLLADRAQRVATLARTITSYPPDAETAFSVALLCNIGQYVFLRADCKRYFELVLSSKHPTILEREFEFYGTTHAEAGAFLLGLLGLPLPLVAQVADHHDRVQVQQSTVLSAIEIAEHIACGSTFEEVWDLVNSGAVAPLNLSERVLSNLTECHRAAA